MHPRILLPHLVCMHARADQIKVKCRLGTNLPVSLDVSTASPWSVALKVRRSGTTRVLYPCTKLRNWPILDQGTMMAVVKNTWATDSDTQRARAPFLLRRGTVYSHPRGQGVAHLKCRLWGADESSRAVILMAPPLAHPTTVWSLARSLSLHLFAIPVNGCVGCVDNSREHSPN
jgi:hypothetical protein